MRSTKPPETFAARSRSTVAANGDRDRDGAPPTAGAQSLSPTTKDCDLRPDLARQRENRSEVTALPSKTFSAEVSSASDRVPR
jgi:hypothetical protein